jgi:hypothetical protein
MMWKCSHRSTLANCPRKLAGNVIRKLSVKNARARQGKTGVNRKLSSGEYGMGLHENSEEYCYEFEHFMAIEINAYLSRCSVVRIELPIPRSKLKHFISLVLSRKVPPTK